MSEQPEALFLADELEAPLGTVISSEIDRRAAIELRRLHAENERLTKLCYDYIGELTAMRAAKQMQARIDKMKGAVASVGLPAGESAAVATAPARREWRGLTEEEREAAIKWAIDLENTQFSRTVARAIEAKLKELNHDV